MTRRRFDLRHNRPIGPISAGGIVSSTPVPEQNPPPTTSTTPPPKAPTEIPVVEPSVIINRATERHRFHTGDLRSAVFYQDHLRSGSLRFSTFVKRDLSRAVFVNVDLFASRFIECNLEATLFIACDLRGAFFDGCRANHPLLIDCDTSNVEWAYVGRGREPLEQGVRPLSDVDLARITNTLQDAKQRISLERSLDLEWPTLDISDEHQVLPLRLTPQFPNPSSGRRRNRIWRR